MRLFETLLLACESTRGRSLGLMDVPIGFSNLRILRWEGKK